MLLTKLLKGCFMRLNPMSKISDVFVVVYLEGLAEHCIFKSTSDLLDRRHGNHPCQYRGNKELTDLFFFKPIVQCMAAKSFV